MTNFPPAAGQGTGALNDLFRRWASFFAAEREAAAPSARGKRSIEAAADQVRTFPSASG